MRGALGTEHNNSAVLCSRINCSRHVCSLQLGNLCEIEMAYVPMAYYLHGFEPVCVLPSSCYPHLPHSPTPTCLGWDQCVMCPLIPTVTIANLQCHVVVSPLITRKACRMWWCSASVCLSKLLKKLTLFLTPLIQSVQHIHLCYINRL